MLCTFRKYDLFRCVTLKWAPLSFWWCFIGDSEDSTVTGEGAERRDSAVALRTPAACWLLATVQTVCNPCSTSSCSYSRSNPGLQSPPPDRIWMSCRNKSLPVVQLGLDYSSSPQFITVRDSKRRTGRSSLCASVRKQMDWAYWVALCFLSCPSFITVK